MPPKRALKFVSLLALLGVLSCRGFPEGSAREQLDGRGESSRTAEVRLLSNQSFQTWQGWCALATGPLFRAPQGGSAPLPSNLLNEILDDAVGDLGINCLRVEFHHMLQVEQTNDNDDPHLINWKSFDFNRVFELEPQFYIDKAQQLISVVQPLKQRVQARGETFYLYAFPHFRHSDFPRHWQRPEEYAEAAEAFITWLRGEAPNSPPGISLTPNYWAIVNEPDNTGFPSSELLADIFATGERFRAKGWPIRIMAPESLTPNSNLVSAALSTAGVRDYLGMISFHGYDYETSLRPSSFFTRNRIRDLAATAGLPTAMNEICCRNQPVAWRGDYAQALGWARDIFWNMTEADVVSWMPLALIVRCSTLGCTPRPGGDPFMVEPDHSRYYKLAHYYGLRQFSHFIRPGFVRVGVTCANCGVDSQVGQIVKPVAFRTPAGTHVVVVINDSPSAQPISLTGFPAGTYDISGIDPAHEVSPVAYPSQTISKGEAITVHFPGQAIVTFVQR